MTLLNLDKLKVKNLEVLFDNSGGITVQCDGYSYLYEQNGAYKAAREFFNFLQGDILLNAHDKNENHLKADEVELHLDIKQVRDYINCAEDITYPFNSQADDFMDELRKLIDKG